MAIFNQIPNTTNIVRACNVKKLLKSISSGSWIATEDCWVSFTLTGRGSSSATLKVDGVSICTFKLFTSSTASSSSDSTMAVPPCFYARKGSVISVTAGTAKMYGCY